MAGGDPTVSTDTNGPAFPSPSGTLDAEINALGPIETIASGGGTLPFWTPARNPGVPYVDVDDYLDALDEHRDEPDPPDEDEAA